ncbi:MAG: thioredoxin family protein [Bacteroidetes bacterium]|nr:thioredoxin family protein [Bacteroidota bacterium]
MKELIKNSLEKAINYQEYRKLVADLVDEGKTTGPNQSENLAFYTKLNQQRMARLDKTVQLNEKTKSALKNIKCDLIWLVMTEGWCGDAAQIMPVLDKVTSESPLLEMKVLLRDDNLELMDHYLTNGGRSIPKVIIIDKPSLEAKASWGPRPKTAQDLFFYYKDHQEELTYQDFQVELQKWYLTDKAQTIQEELLEFLNICEQLPSTAA